MRIISVTTHALNRHRKIETTSVRKFNPKQKPEIRDILNPFWDVEEIIKGHMNIEGRTAQFFTVIISTTKGKFIQGYVKGCFK